MVMNGALFSMGSSHKKRHIKSLALPALCLFLVVGYVVWALAQPLLSLSPSEASIPPKHPAQTVSLPWPAYGEAVVGIAGYGEVASNGGQMPLPTASIAKVMTALAVLRQQPLRLGQQGPTITLNQADIDTYNTYVAKDGSVVKVAIGEQLSEYQALQAMLLPSANNMADTLARWAFGSLDTYNGFANSYAKELGLNSVTITDPSGFLPTTVASAHDLTKLGELAMLNPVFAEIVAQPTATIPVAGTINNYNVLLGTDNNIGIKTGNNNQDKGAYLFAVKQPIGTTSVTIVGTIMSGPNLATVLHDAGVLAQAASKHVTQTTLVKAGQVVGSYHSPEHGTVLAIASKTLSLATWDGTTFINTVSMDTLHTSTNTSQSVGTLTITNSTTHVSSHVPVILQKAIANPSIWWRLTHPL